MSLLYDMPDYKKIRVIVDTDADCEADDPFAIAHALMTKKFIVKAIFAEHFGGAGTTKRSYDEIQTILEAMELSVPVYMGEEGKLSERKDNELSSAAKFLIEEAKKEDEHKLFVLCQGAITNVASALNACPDIASRMTVVWIGGQGIDSSTPQFHEFNSGNDIGAANVVMSSGVDLWLIPSNVYGTMRIGLAELQNRVYPCGKIGKHLFEKMTAYNMTKYADWTGGESWSLGDSPAIAVAIDPCCGTYKMIEAPIFNEDTTYRFESGRPLIRVYTYVDPRFVLEDFMSKLAILYGEH